MRNLFNCRFTWGSAAVASPFTFSGPPVPICSYPGERTGGKNELYDVIGIPFSDWFICGVFFNVVTIAVHVLSSILTLFVTFYGVGFLLNSHSDPGKPKPNHVVPVYMWDIYNNGINSSEIDVIRGVHPAFTGSSFNFRNHRGKLLEFDVPKSNEVLIKAEVRITSAKRSKTYFQIYLKREKWFFLDEKKVSNVEMTWVSLQVTPKNKILKPGRVAFLILTIFHDWRGNGTDFQQPVLLLSYSSKVESDVLVRRKRNLDDYEEKTNRIWKDEALSAGMRGRNSCRRKSLYIKFSEIDYDSWIVAPSGYEAFQCIGKCTFPVGEHLSPTKHAILQTLLHNVSPWKTGRACCVPTRLDPISILYIDENGVLTYRFRYHDMVVAECGCR